MDHSKLQETMKSKWDTEMAGAWIAASSNGEGLDWFQGTREETAKGESAGENISNLGLEVDSS